MVRGGWVGGKIAYLPCVGKALGERLNGRSLHYLYIFEKVLTKGAGFGIIRMSPFSGKPPVGAIRWVVFLPKGDREETLCTLLKTFMTFWTPPRL